MCSTDRAPTPSRLRSTPHSTAATTLRKHGKNRNLEAGDEAPLVLDGPFAETKEQLLGFYVVDCANLEEALAIARELGQANPGGAYEIRPISLFLPGTSGTTAKKTG